MMLFYLIIHILCVFRISYMFVEENGPGDIFARIRLYSIKNRLTHIYPFECFYCTSVWTGLLLSMIVNQTVDIAVLIYGLGISAGSIIVYEVINRLSK